MDRKTIAFRVAGEARYAGRKLMHVGHLGAGSAQSFAHRVDIVHLKGRAGGRAGLESKRLAISDTERRVSDIELDPMVTEGITWFQAEDFGVKRSCTRYVADRISEERDIFDHSQLPSTFAFACEGRGTLAEEPRAFAFEPAKEGTMLVLSRKANQSIMIGSDIRIIVVGVDHDQVKLGIDAPRDVPVHRLEVFAEIHRSGSVGKANAEADISRGAERE
jgi:carbon storage regulator